MILEGMDVGGVSGHPIDVELDEHRGLFRPHVLRARVRHQRKPHPTGATPRQDAPPLTLALDATAAVMNQVRP
jgi:hypothetical protein